MAVTNINPGTVGVTTNPVNVSFAPATVTQSQAGRLVDAFSSVLPAAQKLAAEKTAQDQQDRFTQGQVDQLQKVAAGDMSAPVSNDDYYLAGNLAVFTKAKIAEVMNGADALAQELANNPDALRNGSAIKQLDEHYATQLKGIGSLPGIDINDLTRANEQRMNQIGKLKEQQIKLEKAAKVDELTTSLAMLVKTGPTAEGVGGILAAGAAASIGPKDSVKLLLEAANQNAKAGNMDMLHAFEMYTDPKTGLSGEQIAVKYGYGELFYGAKREAEDAVRKNYEQQQKDAEKQSKAKATQFMLQFESDKASGVTQDEAYFQTVRTNILNADMMPEDKLQALRALPELAKQSTLDKILQPETVANPDALRAMVNNGQVSAEDASKAANKQTQAAVNEIASNAQLTPEQKQAQLVAIQRQLLKYGSSIQLDVVSGAFKNLFTGGLYDKAGKPLGSGGQHVITEMLFTMPEEDAMRLAANYGVSGRRLEVLSAAHALVKQGKMGMPEALGRISTLSLSTGSWEAVGAKLDDIKKERTKLLTDSASWYAASNSAYGVTEGALIGKRDLEQGTASEAQVRAHIDQYADEAMTSTLIMSPGASAAALAAVTKKQLEGSAHVVDGVGVFAPATTAQGTQVYKTKFLNEEHKAAVIGELTQFVATNFEKKFGRKLTSIDMSDPAGIKLWGEGDTVPKLMNWSMLDIMTERNAQRKVVEDSLGLMDKLKLNTTDVSKFVLGGPVAALMSATGKEAAKREIELARQRVAETYAGDKKKLAQGNAWVNYQALTEADRAKRDAELFNKQYEAAQAAPQNYQDFVARYPNAKIGKTLVPVDPVELQKIKPVVVPKSAKDAVREARATDPTLVTTMVHEDLRTVAYKDTGGMAIGFGYNFGFQSMAEVQRDFTEAGIPTDTATINAIKSGRQAITPSQATGLLRAAMKNKYIPSAEAAIKRLGADAVKQFSQWSDGQKAAWYAATYNTGGGNESFNASLFKALNSRNVEAINALKWPGNHDRTRTKNLMAASALGVDVVTATMGR